MIGAVIFAPFRRTWIGAAVGAVIQLLILIYMFANMHFD